MNTGIISMRYAKALFAYATEQCVEDAIYRSVLQLMDTMHQVKELAEVLNAPSLSKEERISLSLINSVAIVDFGLYILYLLWIIATRIIDAIANLL